MIFPNRKRLAGQLLDETVDLIMEEELKAAVITLMLDAGTASVWWLGDLSLPLVEAKISYLFRKFASFGIFSNFFFFNFCCNIFLKKFGLPTKQEKLS